MPQLGSTKSRRGCRQCKQRRVKCDEVVPCGACCRRSEECSFLALDNLSGSSNNPSDPTIPSSREEWALDLELMYHYATTVCDVVGVRQNLVYLWRDYVPQQAIKQSFLMHGILALAALHLAHLRPESSVQYLQTCDKHQAIALTEFRAILLLPSDPQLADARFALAATLSISSMARSSAGMDSAALEIDTIIELFNLTRGVRDMIRLSSEHIRAGSMAPLLHTRRRPESAESGLPKGASDRFGEIQHMLSTYGLDPDALEHCRTALLELQSIYRDIAYILRTEDVEVGDVSRWQVSVSTEYMNLVQARNPPSLIILAHYAAVMAAVKHTWYAQRWAEFALRGISHALDFTMQHWIRWPMEQVQSRMDVLAPQVADLGSTEAF